MTLADSRDRALLDEAGPPAWIFDPVSERIVAANKSALSFFGETSVFALAERSFTPDAPFLSFAHEVLSDGTPRLKRIAFHESTAAGAEACKLEPIRLPGGGPGLLAELHPWRAQPADPEANRLADALRALPVPVILARVDGRVVFANDAANKLLKSESGDLMSRLGHDVARALTDALSARGHLSRAYDVIVQGTPRRLHLEARRQRDPVIGVPLDILILRDLTGLATLESVLTAERGRLNDLLSLAADFTFECDREGRITQLSAGFKTLSGIAPELVTGQSILVKGAPLRAEDGAASLFASAPDRFDELAASLTKPDGTALNLLLSARLRKTAAGELIGYSGVGRRQISQPIRPSDSALVRGLALIVNTTQDTLLIVGGDGRVRFVNSAAQRLFEGERKSLEGRRLSELITPGTRSILAAAGADSLLGSGAEAKILTLSGGEKPVRISIRRVDRAVRPMLSIAITDLSPFKAVEDDLRRARDAAEAANKTKSEFLAKVSHELRTPLNAIIGFAEIMRDEQLGPIDNPRYAGYIRDIHHSGHLLLSLINDLIDLAKVESGRFDLKFAPVDLGRIVGQAVHLMEPAAQTAGVTLDGRVAFDLPPVVADERSLEQVVLNLLSNAIKFTKRGGKVTASVLAAPNGGVTIQVRDNGIGMSPADLKVALEPFRRVNRPDVLEKPGTGLGLPLAKALTEANLANFRIESEPREGTAILIDFPRARVAGR